MEQHQIENSPRHLAYSNSCRAIYKAMSDYYSQQTFEPKKSPEEIRSIVIQIVKDFDKRISAQLTYNNTEADFIEIMNNWTNSYLSNFQEIMMIKEMTSSLNELREFRDQTDFIGENDLNLLQQLIKFVEKIPSANISYPHLQPDFVKHVRLYHDRLFVPIKKTIMRHGINGAQTHVMQQKRIMQMQMQRDYSLNRLSPCNNMSERLPSQRTMKTREHRNMNAIRATSPSRRQLPQKTTENPQILTPELFIKRLFGQVRADCSVFYSTPHPPHF